MCRIWLKENVALRDPRAQKIQSVLHIYFFDAKQGTTGVLENEISYMKTISLIIMAAFFLLISGVVSRGEDNESKLSKMSSSANRPKPTAFHQKKAPVSPTARVNVSPTARVGVSPTARISVSPVAAPMSTARGVGRGGGIPR
jgi:hypothetical protein